MVLAVKAVIAAVVVLVGPGMVVGIGTPLILCSVFTLGTEL